jgi:Tfp pilus assembly protein PilF
MSKKKQILFIYIFLAAATLIAFWQVNHCDFANYDDDPYVTKNVHIQDTITVEAVRWAFTTCYHANWHPLTWISHMLDVQIFGLNPRWHHLTNLFFHIANTLLLFAVLNRVTKAFWRSAFVAALFALHPLHVESVAWVAGRKDVLSTFFWMLTMGAYVYYVERPALQRYLPVLLLFVLGLMAKPMLVTLPLVLLLLDYWPLKRFEQRKSNGEIMTEENGPGSREERKGEATAEGPTDYKYQWALIRPLLLEKIPLVSLAALSSIVTYIAQQEGGAVRSIEDFPLSVRIANAFVSYIAYIGKMIWPIDLAVLYPHPGLWPHWQVIGSVLLFATVTLIVIRRAKRYPYLLTGWFWYSGTLVPVIGLVQGGSQARADRYTYIPLIGLFIIAAWGISELLKRRRYRKEALFLSSALSLSCFFIVTWTQVGYWRNSITLFEHTLKVTDRNSIAYNNLGRAYNSLHNYRQAIGNYDKAIEINPKYALAYYNRGGAYVSLGEYKQAVEDCNKAIGLNPKLAGAYFNRGTAYYLLGDNTRAINDYDKAIDLNPKYAEAYNNRAVAYGSLGNHRQAIEDCSKAIEFNPKYADAYNNRAIAYGYLGNHRQAIDDLKKVARLGHEGTQNFLRGRGINWQ